MTEVKSPVPDPAPGAQAPGISRAIYGMPMFATLLVRDIRATVSWYTTAARPPALADAAFSEQMHEWGNQQGLRPNSPVTA